MSDVYRFKVRIGVVLIHEDKILLARQNNRPFWVYPGGTLEEGESMVDCAVREIKEEVNLDIRVKKLLYLADFVQPKGHSIDVFFLGEYLGGTLVMETTENLNAVGFFDYESFQQMSVQPELATRRILSDWNSGFIGADGHYLGLYH